MACGRFHRWLAPSTGVAHTPGTSWPSRKVTTPRPHLHPHCAWHYGPPMRRAPWRGQPWRKSVCASKRACTLVRWPSVQRLQPGRRVAPALAAPVSSVLAGPGGTATQFRHCGTWRYLCSPGGRNSPLVETGSWVDLAGVRRTKAEPERSPPRSILATLGTTGPKRRGLSCWAAADLTWPAATAGPDAGLTPLVHGLLFRQVSAWSRGPGRALLRQPLPCLHW